MLAYLLAVWSILQSFGNRYLWSFGNICGHLVIFVVIWYNVSRFRLVVTRKNLQPSINSDI
jgi:hypothetical protein